MMTDSQKSFVQVKLWFTKLVNLSRTEQIKQIEEQAKAGTLDDSQVELLKQMEIIPLVMQH